MKNKFNKIYISIAIIFVISLSLFTFFLNKNTESLQNTQESLDSSIVNDFKSEKGDKNPINNISNEEVIFISENVTNKDNVSNDNTQEINTETVSLTAGDLSVDLKISQGRNLYDTLIAKENENLIEFKGKEYPGIGFFVTDIGDLHQGDGKYLMYFINNKEASLGVSSYVPKNGDVIRWELK